MTNLEKAQGLGKQIVPLLDVNGDKEIIIISLLESTMEYTAAILDELQLLRKENE